MIIRLLLSVTLAVIAVGLFILNREAEVKTPAELEREFILSSSAIDKEVDLVLDQFGIEKTWVRKREISDPGGRFRRVERRVAVPPDVLPAMLNRELNSLARRFRGRAVATENLKENSVTIQIILQQTVIQTVIVKVNPEIDRKEPGGQLKKI